MQPGGTKELPLIQELIETVEGGLGEDAFIPEVDSFAGAATFLGEARKGTVNLFI